MRRGIGFEIPNEYGNFLGEMLNPFDIAAFDWRIGDGESYIVLNDRLDKELFPDDRKAIEGAELKRLLEANRYYIISADLQAYPKNEVSHVETFAEFVGSECELVLLVVDCIFVTIYCKNQQALDSLNKNALACGFENIQYITDENDARTRLTVW